MFNSFGLGLSLVMTSFFMSIPIGMGVWVGFWICSKINGAIEIRILRSRIKYIDKTHGARKAAQREERNGGA